MTSWDAYPSHYREREVQAILTAIRGGECVSIVGLSGCGKSNLLGYLAHRQKPIDQEKATSPWFILADLNQLAAINSQAVFRLIRQAIVASALKSECPPLGDPETDDELLALEMIIGRFIHHFENLCILFDRFELLFRLEHPGLFSNLRALRDTNKYALTYVTASRKPMPPDNELSELFYSNTHWLGPLGDDDAAWSARQYGARKGLKWTKSTIQRLIELTWGYPSFLRGACEAHADGAALEVEALLKHPAVYRRLAEFWDDLPGKADLDASGLWGHPFLSLERSIPVSQAGFDTSRLTAKEYLLLSYFQSHPDVVCGKDDLIRAVWPEDKVYEEGIRDDSLAQLVRRLRKKIEPDEANPVYIQTVPGRGYLFKSE